MLIWFALTVLLACVPRLDGASSPPATMPAVPGLAPPLQILAAGKPIAVDQGHAAPFVVDFDRDGRKDLVVGQYHDGRARVYLNKGTEAAPHFDDFSWLRAGDAEARVPPICCMGFDPQFADINADGILDLASGQYSPGIVTLFQGISDGFKPGVTIPELLGPVERDAGGAHPALACASFADWDADGDLDLVFGSASGAVYLNSNLGAPTQPRFGWREPLLADGLQIRVAPKSDPLVVDWDQDGVLDLLIADEHANITFFRGRRPQPSGAPALAAGIRLQIGSETALVPGYRLRIAACDWNSDGKVDLIAGNCVLDNGTVTGHVYALLKK